MLKMLIAVIFNQILLGFILYLRSNLAGMHLFKTDSIVSVLDRLIMIAICSYLIYLHNHGGEFSITWFVYSQTIAYVITVFITLTVVLKRQRSDDYNGDGHFRNDHEKILSVCCTCFADDFLQLEQWSYA